MPFIFHAIFVLFLHVFYRCFFDIIKLSRRLALLLLIEDRKDKKESIDYGSRVILLTTVSSFMRSILNWKSFQPTILYKDLLCPGNKLSDYSLVYLHTHTLLKFISPFFKPIIMWEKSNWELWLGRNLGYTVKICCCYDVKTVLCSCVRKGCINHLLPSNSLNFLPWWKDVIDCHKLITFNSSVQRECNRMHGANDKIWWLTKPSAIFDDLLGL